MTDQDNEIWKTGYDIQERYSGRAMTLADWDSLSNDCRDFALRFSSPLATNMATMLLDYFMDIGQQKAPEAEQMTMG